MRARHDQISGSDFRDINLKEVAKERLLCQASKAPPLPPEMWADFTYYGQWLEGMGCEEYWDRVRLNVRHETSHDHLLWLVFTNSSLIPTTNALT